MSKRRQAWDYRKITIFVVLVIAVLIVLISLISKIFSTITGENDSKKDSATKGNSTIEDKNRENNSEENIEAINTGKSILDIKFEDDYFDFENDTPVSYTIDEVNNKLNTIKETSDEFNFIYDNAELCPDELLIALVNNMELKSYVEGYINNELDKQINDNPEVSNPEDNTNWDINTIYYKGREYSNKSDYPLILQWDQRWGYNSYGESNIAVSGCGPACLTMIINYMKPEQNVNIKEIADYCNNNGYYVYGFGTEWRSMREIPERYGISVEELPLVEAYIDDSLDNGRVIICSVNQGDFTRDGHYLIIYGYDDNGYFVNDPNSIRRSNMQWSYSQLEQQISNIWSYYIK